MPPLISVPREERTVPGIAAAIELELQTLNRRSPRLRTPAVQGPDLERSSYAILCLLHDEGPQRIGRIATAFDLDPSTVTRQVQAVVRLGLAARQQDTADRRATILAITDLGTSTVRAVRDARCGVVADLLNGWPLEDRETFLRLLAQFNTDAAGWSRREVVAG